MSDIKVLESQDQKILEILKYSRFNNSVSTQKTHFYSLWDFIKFFALYKSTSIDLTNDKEKEISKYMEIFCKTSSLEAKVIVTRYLSNLEEKKRSSSTIATRLAALRAHVSLCKEITGIPEWDLSFFKLPKVENKKVPGPSEEEFKKLLGYLTNLEKSSKYIDKRDSLLCYVLAFTGLRISEALSIDLEDIDSDKNKILVSRKGKKLKQEFYVGDIIFKKIEDYVRYIKKIKGVTKGPLFLNDKKDRLSRSSAWRRIRKIGDLVGIKELHPHKFRHFASTEALEATDFNTYQAAKFTSHISKKQLKRYEDERENFQSVISNKIENKWLQKT